MATKNKSQVPALPAPKKKTSDDETIDVSAKKKKKKQKDASRAAALYEEEHPPKPKKKKKRIEEEDEPPRKKRAELALYDEDDGLPRLSKLKGRALRTQFGSGTEKILRLLEQDETDPAIALIYKRLLQSVVDVLPLAEMGIRKSKGVRGVHGFNMLISSLRELMVDVQSAQDRGMMGQTLVMQVMQPAFTDLAQEMVQEFSVLAADVKAQLSDEDYQKFLPLLKESRSRIANRMTHHYNIMRDGVVKFLER
jgi:hypothetical protein